MPDSLSPDNYSFEGYGPPSSESHGKPNQDISHQARSLYEESVKLIGQVKETDVEDTPSIISLLHQLKQLKERAKEFEPTLCNEEFSIGVEDLLKCAQHQVQQTIKEVDATIDHVRSKQIPSSNFKRFLQGDPKTLLYIKCESTGQYIVIGNKENAQKLIQSGKLSQGTVEAAINNGQFGIINLREKVCSTCSQEKALQNLVPHPNLAEVNKKASASIESLEVSEYEEHQSSDTMISLFQEEYSKNPFEALEEAIESLESLAIEASTLSTQIEDKVKELRKKRKDKKEDKEVKGKKKSYGAIMRARDERQDAIATRKMRERLEDERVETKLKDRRDDDQRIETREDTTIQRKMDINPPPSSD